MSKFEMKDYVDVAGRISGFKAKHPEGSLQSECERLADGWFCKAYAYRSPDDPRPGIGHAFEPVPGKTPYTRDSECMNAETSAWGRAIVALGFETKHIASADEVRNRQDAPAAAPDSPFQAPEAKPEGPKMITPAQNKKLGAETTEWSKADPEAVEKLRAFLSKTFDKTSRASLTSVEASQTIEWVLNQKAGLPGKLDEDIPF